MPWALAAAWISTASEGSLVVMSISSDPSRIDSST